MMKTVLKQLTFFVIALLAIFISPLSAQSGRGGPMDDVTNITPIGKQWAVFIAIDKYADKDWITLEYPVEGAKGIKEILLDHYQFQSENIRELYDQEATVEGIRNLFINDLQKNVGVYDSVFVFHAGHGVNDRDGTKDSAWIAYDGSSNNLSQYGWLKHKDVRKLLDNLKARHVFLISDSCYSGDLLLATKGGDSDSEKISDYPAAYAKKSRQVMSSGASELVFDNPEFMSRLQSALLDTTDRYYIEPDFLLTRIKETPTTRKLDTIPHLAVMPESGHELGGSFLFFRKQTNVPIQPAVGSISVSSEIAGEILIDGQPTGTTIKAYGTEIIANRKTGETEVAVKEPNGTITKAAQTVIVLQGQIVPAVPIERPVPEVPEGLEYEEDVDGKSIIITKYSGNATTVNIPERIRGLPVTVIGGRAFENCSSLTSITIPSPVTTIDYFAFAGCTSLTSVTIPSSVTTILQSAFASCSSLTSVSIPSSVTTIGHHAFSYCSSLTDITVDSRNSAYTSVDGVLFNKNVRILIAYPGGKKGSYTIPSSVTIIGDRAFFGCSSLPSVTIPSSVTTIGEYAFYECSSLISITIPSSVTTIGDYAFSYCSSLFGITVDSRNSAYTSVDGVLFDKNVRTIIMYPEGKKGNYSIPSSVTTIGHHAFSNCSSLTSVSIPSSVTTIGDWAFSYCYSLTSVSVTLPSSVTTIGNSVFWNCYSLTSIIIPSSVTTIGDHAFFWCESLTSVTIPSSVTTIGFGAFWNCFSLTSITIPSSVTAIGDYAFSDCSSLSSVTLSRRTRVGEDAFPASARIRYSD